jgi:hypothetical protein
MRPSFSDADPLTEQLLELTPRLPGEAEQLYPSAGYPLEDLRLDLAQGAFFGASSVQHDGPDTSLAPLHGGPDGL